MMQGCTCSVVLKDSSSLRVKQKLQSAKGPTAGRMKSYSGLKQSVVSVSNYLHGFSCPLHHQSKDVQLLSLVFSSSELLLASSSTVNNVALPNQLPAIWSTLLGQAHTMFGIWNFLICVYNVNMYVLLPVMVTVHD